MTTAELIETTAAEMGIGMTAKFVPFSQSRNAGEKTPSLNWNVTLTKAGHEILTTDYMAGCGHCPSSELSVKELGHQKSVVRTDAIRRECETGFDRTGGSIAKPLMPQFADVLHSLVLDASVLDAGGFEDWASEFDYDTDSRKAEAIYQACLEIALKLRAALGEAGLTKLREACQDY